MEAQPSNFDVTKKELDVTQEEVHVTQEELHGYDDIGPAIANPIAVGPSSFEFFSNSKTFLSNQNLLAST